MNTNNHPTKLLGWSRAQPIFQFYLNVFENYFPLNWASNMWHVLGKKGYTTYNNEEEEFEVYRLAIFLCLLYYEYCVRSGQRDETFRIWDDEILHTFKNEFVEDYKRNSDILFNYKVKLFSVFEPEEINLQLWINCLEAQQQYQFTQSEKDTIEYNLSNESNVFFEDGLAFLYGTDIDSLEAYESISGQGII